MIFEENKEFCSSITTLDMRFTRLSKKSYSLGPSDPIDLKSREAMLILERFKFYKNENPTSFNKQQLLKDLLGFNPLSELETYIEADNKDNPKVYSKIAASINISLLRIPDAINIIKESRIHIREEDYNDENSIVFMARDYF
jgi:hypothetical protein